MQVCRTLLLGSITCQPLDVSNGRPGHGEGARWLEVIKITIIIIILITIIIIIALMLILIIVISLIIVIVIILSIITMIIIIIITVVVPITCIFIILQAVGSVPS